MPIKTVDAATLKRWMEAKEAIVIDVREPGEHAAQKIKDTWLLSLGNVSTKTLPEIHNKKIVIHCHSGKRSASACKKLLAEDPNLEIYNLEGGISGWCATGYDVVTSRKCFLPLDRQVQLTIGLMLTIGSLLGYMFSPAWFLFTGFIGCGLTIAGITGFCSLAIVMAKMPWNTRA